MKILFVFPYWTHRFNNFKKLAEGVAFPPLNLCYLAAIAQRDGHTVEIIDGEAEKLSKQEVMERIKVFNPDLIGMTATTSFFDIVSDYAKTIRTISKAKIVIGGVHVTYFGKQIFEKYFDYFVIGRCETTFASFLRNPAKTKGIIYWDGDTPVFTGNNDGIPDLDALPWASRALLRHDLYKVGSRYGSKPYTTMAMSFGCPFKCVFCNTSVYGNKVFRRSVGSVVSEIWHIVYELGIKHIYFIDDTLTLDRKFIIDVCTEIIDRKIKFTWESSTRANLVDYDLLRIMKWAGCIRLSFGLESADEGIRKTIRKEVPLEAYVEANRITNRLGIETINSVMMGLPDDTPETIERTIDFVRNSREIIHATFSIAIPYPGTQMWQWALGEMHGLRLVSKDFSRYQRYGSAVMEVNGMTPEDLLSYQRLGLMRIYMVWWRIIPVIRRFGIKALIKPFFSSLWSMIKTLEIGRAHV